MGRLESVTVMKHITRIIKMIIINYSRLKCSLIVQRNTVIQAGVQRQNWILLENILSKIFS